MATTHLASPCLPPVPGVPGLLVSTRTCSLVVKFGLPSMLVARETVRLFYLLARGVVQSVRARRSRAAQVAHGISWRAPKCR